MFISEVKISYIKRKFLTIKHVRTHARSATSFFGCGSLYRSLVCSKHYVKTVEEQWGWGSKRWVWGGMAGWSGGRSVVFLKESVCACGLISLHEQSMLYLKEVVAVRKLGRSVTYFLQGNGGSCWEVGCGKSRFSAKNGKRFRICCAEYSYKICVHKITVQAEGR